jgi:hypothetical protein
MQDQVIDIPGVGPVSFPASMSDSEIEKAAAKLYADAQAQTKSQAPKAPLRPMNGAVIDALTGALKGLGSTAANIGEMAVNSGLIPGVTPAALSPTMRHPIFHRAEQVTTPSNTAEAAGKGVEQIAEFFIPAVGQEARVGKVANRVVNAKVFDNAVNARKLVAPAVRAADEALMSAAVAKAQGGDPVTTGATAGAMTLAMPVVGAAARSIPKVGRWMVRNSLRPTATELKDIPMRGTSAERLDKLAQDVIDNRLYSAKKAEEMLEQSYATSHIIQDEARDPETLSQILKNDPVKILPNNVSNLKAGVDPKTGEAVTVADGTYTTPKPFVQRRLTALIEDLSKQSVGAGKDIEAVGDVWKEYTAKGNLARFKKNPIAALDSAMRIKDTLKGKTVGELSSATQAALKEIELAEREFAYSYIPGLRNEARLQGTLKGVIEPLTKAETKHSPFGGFFGGGIGGGAFVYHLTQGRGLEGAMTALITSLGIGAMRNPRLHRVLGIHAAELQKAIEAGDEAGVWKILNEAGIKSVAGMTSQATKKGPDGGK